MSLEAREVSWRAGGALVVDGVSLTPEPGSTVGLLGPNGSGKSSLLRLLSGVRRTAGGVVLLDGRPLPSVSRRQLARRIAVVDQHADTEVDLTVDEVVHLGRIPHRQAWAVPSPADTAAVDEAIRQAGLEELRRRSWRTLSGGERQRTQIARALAQQPAELLLDEPTNHLDIRHQLDLLTLIRNLPLTSVIALHDLNLAAMFCDHLLVLKAGRVVAGGSAKDVLTPVLIEDVYGVRAEVRQDTADGNLAIRYLPG